jgi:PAT family beta-lactamase induction signal transducer AmpG
MALVSMAIPLFDPSSPSRWLWVILLLFTIASATQDIAIDAYSIGLLFQGEEGIGNGVRFSDYRIALLVGGGGLLMAAELTDWGLLYLAVAVAFACLSLLAWRAPLISFESEPIKDWLRAFSTWLRQPGALFVLLFILLYKLGDTAMGPMVKPFWIDRGLTLKEIGLISTGFGVGASIFGSLLGGVLTTKWGIFHGLWSLGLLQALSNLGYAATAYSDGGRAAIYAASLFESFTGGLGTAAFLAFLMRICEKERAATEYALLSALFGLTRSVSGAFSGWGTSRLGYALYFSTTFFLALPAYTLLPWVRTWIGEEAGSHSSNQR